MKIFLILLTIIFIPFVWFIVRMLRFTKETVGEDSPLYVERTYRVTAFNYFGDFVKVIQVVLVPMMLAIAWIISQAALKQNLLFLLFIPFFLAFAGYICFVIYFDWQYWTVTRNVLVTFSPSQPAIIIDTPAWYSVLTPGTIIRIELHLRKTSNSKDLLGGYGYFLFYGTEGQLSFLNRMFFSNFIHYEFLDRFFPGMPLTIVQHRLPWISEFNRMGNHVPTNFDA